MIKKRKEGVVNTTFHEDDHTFALRPITSLEKTFLILNEINQKSIGKYRYLNFGTQHCASPEGENKVGVLPTVPRRSALSPKTVVKTTGHEVVRGLREVAWPHGLASLKAKSSSRPLLQTIVKTTGREVACGLGKDLAKVGQPWPLA
ncbi:hypothetical protein H5410_031090 [Solanum commersonii]|uniref:Uncharacterized protein n=1 Tax=Solanum commersonii TaxID=4109 RepID=A0A9J5YJ86_SOLCO|nr:hypothetical protein H5410_031090 [Solanum commersonii]